MKYFSMFSGIGGFEVAIEKVLSDQSLTPIVEERQGRNRTANESGGNVHDRPEASLCVGYSEIDKFAISVYEKHFKGVKNYGDATKINAGELPDFDLLVGGFPCQAFSVAGKRRGFDETRGTLFFDVARIIANKRPRYLVLENVKGLLTHKGGETFQTILRVLTELGYVVEWRLFNSKGFGVPQNRERVYITGRLGGKPRPEIFFIEGTKRRNSGQDSKLTQIVGGSQDQRVYDKNGLSPTLSTMQGGNKQPKIIAQNQRREVRLKDDVGSLQTSQSAGQFEVVALAEERSEEAKELRRKMKAETGKDFSPRRGKVLRPRTDNGVGALTSSRNDENLIAKTIRVGGGGSPHGSKQNWDSYEIDGRIRRLTPMECERLQAFPDNWTAEATDKPISDSQRYKMCGNAITTNVAEAVIGRLLNASNS